MKKKTLSKLFCLIVRAETQGISFQFRQFFCICYVFLLTVFLCFYCTHAVTDDVEKTLREKEKEGARNWKESPGFVWFQANPNNIEQIRENESNL